MKELKEKWSMVQTLLKDNLQDISYETWFAPLTPLRTDTKTNQIFIDPYASMNQNILTSRYMPLLENTIKEAMRLTKISKLPIRDKRVSCRCHDVTMSVS